MNRTIFGATVLGLAVAIAAVDCVRIHREEAAKRAQLQLDYELNVAAARRASDVMRDRIRNDPNYRPTIAEVARDYVMEDKFQQIAIRES